jgi:hypothetical protein
MWEEGDEEEHYDENLWMKARMDVMAWLEYLIGVRAVWLKAC